MPIVSTQKNRSRLPDPIRLPNYGSDPLINFIDDLVKTIRIRFESVELALGVIDNQTKVTEVSGVSTFVAGFDAFIYLIDADVSDVDFELPDPLAAFNFNAVFTVRETGGVNDVILTPVNGEDIEGGPTYTVSAGTHATFVSDGTNWFVVGT